MADKELSTAKFPKGMNLHVGASATHTHTYVVKSAADGILMEIMVSV
jgi:hypothetical protein